jgi:hypothetical protein
MVLLTGSLIVPNSQKSVLAELTEAANGSNVVIYPVDIQDSFISSLPDAANGDGPPKGGGGGRRRGGGGGGGGSGDETDPPSTDPNADNLQFLSTIASGTGGFLIRNSGELPEGIRKIGEEQDERYVLSYRPPDSKEGVWIVLG